MSAPFRATLTALMRHRGVLGCLVVEEEDGLVVDAVLQYGVDAEAAAALASLLYRRVRLSTRAAGLGTVTYLRLEAERGSVCVAGRGQLLLAVVADVRSAPGPLRAAIIEAVDALG